MKVFEGFTDGRKIIRNATLEVWGRKLIVPKSTGVVVDRDDKQGSSSSSNGSVAMFTFEELCGDPLSAADYLEIVRHFDTVFITGLPKLSLSEKDKVSQKHRFSSALYTRASPLTSDTAFPTL